MAVSVNRELNVLMSNPDLETLQIDSLCNPARRCRVTKRVEAIAAGHDRHFIFIDHWFSGLVEFRIAYPGPNLQRYEQSPEHILVPLSPTLGVRKGKIQV